jgi:hypothetical protein
LTTTKQLHRLNTAGPDFGFQNGFNRKDNKLLSQGRYFYENRWGGELQWEKNTAVELTFMVKAFTQNDGITGCL